MQRAGEQCDYLCMNRSVVIASSLIIASAIAFTAGRVSMPATVSAATAPRWEYKLSKTDYGIECGERALRPYKDTESVKQWVSRFGPSHEVIALLYGLGTDTLKLPSDAMGKITDEYLTCGDEAFVKLAKQYGDDGWDMVSYDHMSYTSSGTEYRSGLVINHGYEVMWKRPAIR